MFSRLGARRAVIPPLSHAAGSNIEVRSETELRNAVGEIARRGHAGRIVIADDIRLQSGVDLTSLPPLEIASAGGSTVYATGAYAFGIGSSDCTISGVTIRGASDSAYAAKGISLNQTVNIENARILGCRIFATECIKDEDAAGNSSGEISGNYLEADDGSNFDAVYWTGANHIIHGNLINCPGAGTATNVCLTIYNVSLTAVSGNRFVNGSMEIDGSSSTACSRNAITGNSTSQGIREVNNGGYRNAFVGNVCSTITTNLGNGDNVIMGNAGSVTVTAQAGDLYQTATDSDPLNT